MRCRARCRGPESRAQSPEVQVQGGAEVQGCRGSWHVHVMHVHEWMMVNGGLWMLEEEAKRQQQECHYAQAVVVIVSMHLVVVAVVAGTGNSGVRFGRRRNATYWQNVCTMLGYVKLVEVLGKYEGRKTTKISARSSS